MRRAFTVVELLVVIGIIAILAALLLPVIAQVRRSGDRTACRAALHDIGMRMQMYFNDSQNRLPYVNVMPSITPPLNTYPTLVQILAPYTGPATDSYRCRADIIKAFSPSSPPGYSTYFDREGSSYQYSETLAASYAGKQLKDVPLYKDGRMNLLRIVSDYEPFHGTPGTPGAMNHLFADMHVGDLAQ